VVEGATSRREGGASHDALWITRINVTKLFMVGHVQSHDKSDQIVKNRDVRFVFRSTRCMSPDQKQVVSSDFHRLSFPGFACLFHSMFLYDCFSN
jgi:hypothetical protein